MSSQVPSKEIPWRAEFINSSGIFAPFATAAAPFAASAVWPSADSFNSALAGLSLTNAAGVPLTFATSLPKPKRRRKPHEVTANAAGELSYEERIFQTGEVPTRPESWHDFFNMLVWAIFPRAKAALNERQCRGKDFASALDLARGQGRTREQDRLAIFDEGGAIIVRASEDLAVNPAAAPRWAVVFGHAVHELKIKGAAAPTLRLLAAPCVRPAAFFAQNFGAASHELDAEIAARVRAGFFADGGNFESILLGDIEALS